MATIHSFPTELIRHILALAYPPGPARSRAGLCKTSLVHSSWLKPSFSVMVEQVVLNEESAAKFAASGPVGWSCKELCLNECAGSDLLAVLAKAEAGGIAHLAITLTKEKLHEGVFDFASVQELRSVRLITKEFRCDHSYWWGPCPCAGWGRDPWDERPRPEYDLVLTRGPAQLRTLSLHAPSLASALFLPSAKTLTDLTLYLTSAAHFAQLEQITGQLAGLRTLRVPLSWSGSTPFTLSPAFAAFVAGLPGLTTLDIVDVLLQQLEQLFKALEPAQPLRTLQTRVPTIHKRNWDQVDYAQWVTEWVPSLRRCAGLLAGLGWKRWDLMVVLKEGDMDVLDYGTLPSQNEMWKEPKEGWAEFLDEVKAGGVKLELEGWDVDN